MCGRFNVIDTPGLRELLAGLGIDLSLPQRVNIAPTEPVSLVIDEADERRVADARWWLTPAWAPAVDQKYAMFNARAEGLSKSRAFRQPFRSQRGLVPMTSFIEWRLEEGVKQPWLIEAAEGALAVAALWDVWRGGEQPLLSCALVTTAAPPQFEPWHSRMPLLLCAAERLRWLDNSRPVGTDDPMFRRELKQPLVLAPLSRAVSNARHKDAALMSPAGDRVALGA